MNKNNLFYKTINQKIREDYEKALKQVKETNPTIEDWNRFKKMSDKMPFLRDKILKGILSKEEKEYITEIQNDFSSALYHVAAILPEGERMSDPILQMAYVEMNGPTWSSF